MVIGPAPGPPPAAHARPSTSPAARSNWRAWPHVNERRNDPTVDGAAGANPNTAPVAPARSRST